MTTQPCVEEHDVAAGHRHPRQVYDEIVSAQDIPHDGDVLYNGNMDHRQRLDARIRKSARYIKDGL